MISTKISYTAGLMRQWAAVPAMVQLDAQPPRAPMDSRVTGEALCQLVTDWNPSRFPDCGTALVEQKHDGIRALWLRAPDGPEICTREGAPMLCASHAAADLKRLESAFGRPMVLDAEYVEPGGFEATKRSFETGGRVRDPNARPGLLMVFDAVPLDVWEGSGLCAPLAERKDALRLAMTREPSPHLRYVAHATVMSAAEAEQVAMGAIERGHEGVLIKDSRAGYVRERSSTWQRIKRQLRVDCPIVDVEPVEHPAGIMAALIVEHRGRQVRITIGLTPAERRELWTFWPRLIGRVVEVEAMEITAAGSLRQPRFGKWKGRV